MINYHNKQFRLVNNTGNGEVTSHTVFKYRQSANIVTAAYSGGNITSGHLIALVDESGKLNMRYHHINNEGLLMTGTCTSVPEILPDGKIRLHEQWQWTCGDESIGQSVLEEI